MVRLATELATGIDPGDLRGAVMGRYHLLEPLGSGGMGVVYDAYDPELDRRVAVKLIRPRSGQASESGSRRLLREAQALAQLSHPNVVPVFDVGRHGSLVFIAMKRLEGVTLRQWGKERLHPWRRVLTVYRAAARGLIAAHEGGLVHRDFKPGNVILEDDGGVAVFDFGLAAADLSVLSEDEGQGTSGLDAISETLTATGTVVGTPAYMAPEQAMRGKTDARTDQFAFCVSLFEALYGARPYDGKGGRSLLDQKLAGRTLARPRGTAVPARVHDVMMRGLSPSADRRWGTMRELLAALERAKRPRRWPWVAVTAAGLGVAALALAPTDGSCPAQDELAQVWNADARARVEAAFQGTGLPSADAALVRAATSLDTYVASWEDARRQLCTDTDRSASDPRAACLSQRVAAVRSLVDVLSDADPEVVARSQEAVDSLTPADACLDMLHADEGLPMPTPEQAPAVRDVRRLLEQARAVQGTGRHREAHEINERALTQARRVDYAPVLAEALRARGDTSSTMGHPESARADLEDAHFIADGLGYDRVVRLSAVALTHLVGIELGDQTEGMKWARRARAAFGRDGSDTAAMGRLLVYESMIHHELGQMGKAREVARRGLEALEEAHGPNSPKVGPALSNLAMLEPEPETAIPLYERSLSIQEAALGPDHPQLIAALNNLGRAHFRAAQPDLAQPYNERALAITERVYGPDHPDAEYSHAILGAVAYLRDEYEVALEHHRRAFALRERASESDDPRLTTGANNIALVYDKMGRLDDAIEWMERAIRYADGDEKGRRLRLAVPHRNLANMLRKRGDDAEAVEHLLESERLLLAADEPDAKHIATTAEALAATYLDLSKATSAVAAVERVRDVVEVGLEQPYDTWAEALLRRAQGLHAMGSAAQAREALAVARRSADSDEMRQEIDDWAAATLPESP